MEEETERSIGELPSYAKWMMQLKDNFEKQMLKMG
jgi:hypothetical protein